jgi:hypothetical protein
VLDERPSLATPAGPFVFARRATGREPAALAESARFSGVKLRFADGYERAPGRHQGGRELVRQQRGYHPLRFFLVPGRTPRYP